MHGHAVGVADGEVDVGRVGKKAAAGELALAFDGDGAAVIHAERPLANVEVVGAPVGHLTVGALGDEAEIVVAADGRVGPPRSGPEPEIPIEVGRHGLGFPGGVAEAVVGWNPAFDAVEFTETVVAHEFSDVVETFHRAVLGAVLRHAAVFAGGLDDGATLGDGEGQRFLDVDILAVAHRVDGDQRVPVVGRADEDGVDVGTAVEFAEVAVGFAIGVLVGGVDADGGGFDAVAVHVANGEDLE